MVNIDIPLCASDAVPWQRLGPCVCTCWSHAPGRHRTQQEGKVAGAKVFTDSNFGIAEAGKQRHRIEAGEAAGGRRRPHFPDHSETRGHGQELFSWPWGLPRQETRHKAWGSVPLRKSDALAVGSQEPRPLDPLPRTVSWSLPRTAQGPTLALAASLWGTPMAPVCRQGHQTRGLCPDGPQCSHGQGLSTKARR